MADSTLTPDFPSTDEAPSRQLRLVTTGLPPTAEVPTSASKKPETPPAYAPCPHCRAGVLTGALPSGERVALEVGVRTYVAIWETGTPILRLVESQGYLVHCCAGVC